MKLGGEYSFDDIKRTFQGNFGCQSVTKDQRGNDLGDGSYVRLELFFLRIDFYPQKHYVDVFRVDTSGTGENKLVKICTIPTE